MISAIASTTSLWPCLGLFVQHILRSYHLQTITTDIINIYNSSSMFNITCNEPILTASSLSSPAYPHQVWNFAQYITFYTNLIDLRMHSTRPQLLFVSVFSDFEQLKVLLNYQSELIVEYFVHTHPMIVADATGSDADHFQSIVARYFPHDAAIVFAGCDEHDGFRVLQASHDLRYGHVAKVTFRQRMDVLRDRQFPIESFVYQFETSRKQRDQDQPYVRLLEEYFRPEYGMDVIGTHLYGLNFGRRLNVNEIRNEICFQIIRKRS